MKYSGFRLFWRACFVASLAAGTARAGTIDVTITMDDLPLQAIDEMVHPSGVAFNFSIDGVPSLDAD